MQSTKLMLLGVLIMLLGTGLSLSITQFVALSVGGPTDFVSNFAYIGAATIIVGFIVGVVGFFIRQ